MTAEKKNEKSVSIDYELVSDSKSRYARKRCGNILDSPCLTLFLFIIMLCSVAYLVFGILSSKNKLDFLKKSKESISENNAEEGFSKEPFSENFLGHFPKDAEEAKQMAGDKCDYDVGKLMKEPSNWPEYSSDTSPYDSFNKYLQSINIFDFYNEKISLKSQLFCAEEHCTFSNQSLTFENQHFSGAGEKFYVLEKCQIKEILWLNSRHNEEKSLLDKTFSLNDLTFRFKTKKEFIKIKCLIQEITQGNVKKTFEIEESLFQIPKERNGNRGVVKNMFGNLFGKKTQEETNYNNILILTINSISKKSFYRNMKKTHEFLSSAGPLQMLHGFKNDPTDINKNAHPLTKDLNWDLLPDTYKSLIASDHVDASTSPEYYKSSRNVTTTHYLVPFWISIKNNSEYKSYKNIPKYQYTLYYIQDFFNSYRNNPKIAVGVLQNFVKTPKFDEDLEKFLSSIQKTKDFSTTTIIMVGGTSEHTENFEEHPFALVLPSRILQENQPSAIQHLKTNSDMLTDYKDVHQTIMRLVSNKGKMKEGISLFEKFPSEKLCRV